MKRLILGLFTFLSLSVSVAVLAPQATFAFICVDGTDMGELPEAVREAFSEEEERALMEDQCEEHGGLGVAVYSACSTSFLLGFPTWYKYLETRSRTEPATGATVCDVNVDSLSDVWLIVAAVLEMLLRIAAMAAVLFVVVGGVMYILSQGNPDKTKAALNTIISALVGLVISITAAVIVTFVAGRFN